jgi:ketose-bisphosphate aldolase
MLVPFIDALGEAQRGTAVGAFTCYDLEVAAAVLETAAREDLSVIVLVSPSSVRGDRGESFLSAVLAYVERAPARCCVQVDHVDDLQLIERVLELGAGAVMADGSRLPLDENIALVRAAVGLASATGAAVEAELGRVEGDEDLTQATREGRLTEPQQARQFVAESGAACLAVSIGNAHGRYSTPPSLDWDRLEAIRAQVAVPLALHGASGLPDASIQQALALGIGKVNVNTELREAYLRATADALGNVRETAAVGDLHRTQTVAVAEIVARKLRLLRSEGRR